jgi:hypothetical protein
MCGLAVADEDDTALRAAVQTCRAKLGVPENKALHWQEHAKKYSRRQYVAAQFSALPLVVNYVVFEKAAIPAASQLWNNHLAFYNYAAGILMERLLLTARDWPGGPRKLVAKFGHVRGVDHADTLAYFEVKRAQAEPWVPWHLLSSPAQFVGAGAYLGMQAADQYAGMLGAALIPDELGGYEQHHLLAVSHQIRRCDGRAWGYGFKVMGRPGCMESYPWWPTSGL